MENFVTVIAVAIPTVWLGLIVQAYLGRAAEKREMATGISHCRQIIAALKAQAADHAGTGEKKALPEPKTANEKFRTLFRDKILTDESIFGCPQSPFVPDGNTGSAPEFTGAVKAGENHWMVTKGNPEPAQGFVPLVYENAIVAEWNPKWSADAKRKPVPGRTWTKGIIIGMNDGSVHVHALAAKKGAAVPLEPVSDAGKTLFTLQGDAFQALDIER